jgi:hypothetical protein
MATTVDYTALRPNRRRLLERCPACGRTGLVLRVPLTRGPDAGRTRVSWTHREDRTDLGVCVRVENQVACWGWEG